jgi:hypothetical protein
LNNLWVVVCCEICTGQGLARVIRRRSRRQCWLQLACLLAIGGDTPPTEVDVPRNADDEAGDDAVCCCDGNRDKTTDNVLRTLS